MTTNPSDLGNINAYSVGYRWYPFMFSRGGLAWHNEFSIIKTVGAGVSLNGQPPPLTTPVWSQSVYMGFDFAF
jgi:hypothetical protein